MGGSVGERQRKQIEDKRKRQWEVKRQMIRKTGTVKDKDSEKKKETMRAREVVNERWGERNLHGRQKTTVKIRNLETERNKPSSLLSTHSFSPHPPSVAATSYLWAQFSSFSRFFCHPSPLSLSFCLLIVAGSFSPLWVVKRLLYYP